MSCWFWGGEKKNWQQCFSFPPSFLSLSHLSLSHSVSLSVVLSRSLEFILFLCFCGKRFSEELRREESLDSPLAGGSQRKMIVQKSRSKQISSNLSEVTKYCVKILKCIVHIFLIVKGEKGFLEIH